MSSSRAKTNDTNVNPFLTDKADELWKRLDSKGTRISKDELLARAEELKNKSKK